MNGRYNGFAETTDQLLKYIDRTENYKKHCIEKISECDSAISDLNHELELENLNAIRLTQNNIKRRELLRDRRKYKDDYEYTSLIVSKMPNVQEIHNQLKTLKISLKDEVNKHNNRKYTPRTNIVTTSGAVKIIEAQQASRKQFADTEKLREVDQSGIIKKDNKKKIEIDKAFQKIAEQRVG